MTTFRDYSAPFSADVRRRLSRMRNPVKKAAPKAKKTISYGMPAFTRNDNKFAWFAAFKGHIGFYPGAAAITAFEDELASYKVAKGSVQFPLDEPVPLKLVSRISKFAAARRLRRAR